MFPKRYLELCSTYRDRTRFPNPAQFMVELSTSGRFGVSGAKDPVYTGVVSYPSPNDATPTTYKSFGYMYAPTLDGSLTPSEYIVGLLPVSRNVYGETTILPLSPDENAYVGDTLELVVKTGSPTTTHEYRTITDYEVLTDQQLLTGIVDGTAISATDFALTGASMACDIDGFFNGWTIEFVSVTDGNLLGVTRIVEFYRAVDRRLFLNEPIEGVTITAGDEIVLKTDVYQVTLNEPFSVGTLPVLGSGCEIAANTTYRIRTDVPRLQGTLAAGTSNTFTLPASVGTTDFTGNLLWITSDPVVASGTLASTAASTFTLSAGFANVFPNDFLNNMSINITAGGFTDTTYTIRDWDNGTLTGTVSPAWDASGGSPGAVTFTITQPFPNNYHYISAYNTTTRVGTINRSFMYTNLQGTPTTYSVDASTTFELLQFNRDNYNALDYTSSVVAQQQTVCYELELHSLTLPNVPLTTGWGKSIAYYPYVYVELSSVMQGSTTTDLHSNNPHAKKMLFRAPILYNFQPELQDFVVTDGHRMVQTIKFSPNDAFLFSVYLPNGELFTTTTDYVSPSEPNPHLQVSACFSMKRL